ncbi:MAG: hypothetical protein KDD47_25440, partial [Acidobacteria bacterium]|nr:hypothetical protein [Acidobacteriota bacterium]
MKAQRRILAALAVSSATLWALPAAGVLCNVPADRATLGDAVLDPTCTEIVLAQGVFAGPVVLDRDLILRGAGAGSVIAGPLSVEGSGTAVTLSDLTVDLSGLPGFLEGVTVGGGAEAVLT